MEIVPVSSLGLKQQLSRHKPASTAPNLLRETCLCLLCSLFFMNNGGKREIGLRPLLLLKAFILVNQIINSELRNVPEHCGVSIP